MATLGPLPYIGTGSQSQLVLGHYAQAQKSGSVAATLSAASAYASIRWAPSLSSAFMALMKLRCGVAINSTVTTGVAMDVGAFISRSFTTDMSANNTQISLVSKSGAMRTSMQGSLLGTKGPNICTTTGMTTIPTVIDAQPFAAASMFYSSVTVGVGSTQMFDLYKWDALGAHPPVFVNNEGVVVENLSAGPASGTYIFYAEWDWAEVLTF